MRAKLLLSTQRAGSHFVKALVQAHFPSVVCSGELLGQPVPFVHQLPALPGLPEVSAFWAWYEAEAAAGRISVAPDRRIAAFEKYLAMLASLVKPHDLVFDVKYNSIRSLSGYWDTEYGSDNFVSFIEKHEIPVLHLIRRNTLRAIISAKLAQHTGIWQRTEERSPDEILPRIRLNPKTLLGDIQYQQGVSAFYGKRFAGYEHYESVVYEDLVDEQHNVEPGLNLRTIAHFIGKPLVGPNCAPLHYKKTTPEDPSEVVENWNEILRLLQGTEHVWMIQNPFLAAA